MFFYRSLYKKHGSKNYYVRQITYFLCIIIVLHIVDDVVVVVVVVVWWRESFTHTSGQLLQGPGSLTSIPGY